MAVSALELFPKCVIYNKIIKIRRREFLLFDHSKITRKLTTV